MRVILEERPDDGIVTDDENTLRNQMTTISGGCSLLIVVNDSPWITGTPKEAAPDERDGPGHAPEGRDFPTKPLTKAPARRLVRPLEMFLAEVSVR
jgi:hypothetical protein